MGVRCLPRAEHLGCRPLLRVENSSHTSIMDCSYSSAGTSPILLSLNTYGTNPGMLILFIFIPPWNPASNVCNTQVAMEIQNIHKTGETSIFFLGAIVEENDECRGTGVIASNTTPVSY